jgi:hypothetical protein
MSWAAVAGAGIGLAGSLFGGSDDQQTSQSTSTFTPPEWLNPYWQNYVNSGMSLANQPTPQYGGMTVAPPSSQQYQGTDMLTGIATEGTPTFNAGQSALVHHATGGAPDPYATMMNPVMGMGNPYMGAVNPYQGDNPYLQSVIDASNQDITDAYSTGTAAQTDSAFNRSNAFGGSAYQQQTEANQRALGRVLAQNTSGLRSQNYYNSANLAESGLNRNTNTAQGLLGLNAGLGEGALNRASGAWQQGQGRSLTAAGMAPQYQTSDINAISAMMNAGAGNQAYQQQLLDQMRNYFNTSANDPYNRLGFMGGLLGGASGNSVTTNSTANVPGQSPFANAAAGAMAGYGMFGGGGGSPYMPYLPNTITPWNNSSLATPSIWGG